MSELAELEEWVTLIDACVEPLAKRPVDLTDPGWAEKMRKRPHPLDEAGVRPEAEAALREVLSRYEEGGEDARVALRALLDRCGSFRWATSLPYEPTQRGFRQRLLEISVEDQGIDGRDMMVGLNGLSGKARDAGVDIRPLLREVAALSSDVDVQGMGSTRSILLRATEMEPPALW
ncbi:hypothetical protein NMG29_29775 [Streptomyces cocklensis]|uniref:Uncharacterized protein n=1 Tax=Actinacidiphila cocklensis TaxID=887465 RepID=A0A9W4DRF1_9ACTN|nr:hypothetical protein [Actinacidiphila cocklensis]MDD1062364.1 hypothetical protein [Actinacidiphila cocklensis]CAG6392648.1 conserved hypothetical protein [Actinacidiphila cocklensis]